VAIWHTGPVSGTEYWLYICTSPELFIFVLFMMSDPRTAPRSGLPRVVYGATTALVAAALIFPKQSEFGVKVALLAGLTVTCALVPLIEALSRRVTEGRRRGATTALGEVSRPGARVRAALRAPAFVAATLITVAAAAGTLAVASNAAIVDLERTPVAPGAPSPQ
jgi:hypothetical protein